MKVVYSSVKLVSFQQLKYLLLLLPFLVAIAFGSNVVERSPENEEERYVTYADFIKLQKQIDALRTESTTLINLQKQIDALRTESTTLIKMQKQVEALRTESTTLIKMQKQVDALRTESTTLLTKGGAVYIRWGRNVCGPGSDALYKGVAGGSWWNSHGGGSNYLCLPLDPIWGTYNEGAVKYSQLYGAEYELPSAFGLNNNQWRPLRDNNVPCVVCRSQTKTSVVMIPARNQCYIGMHTEYTGLLVSMAAMHKGRTEFVCMDGQPESDPAGYRNEEGALFYNVEAACGSLPCPPYTPRREVTCAVCTK